MRRRHCFPLPWGLGPGGIRSIRAEICVACNPVFVRGVTGSSGLLDEWVLPVNPCSGVHRLWVNVSATPKRKAISSA